MRRGNYIEPEERKYLSTEGYRANSPDRNRPMNIINSNEISMEDVNHRVLGIDDEDNEIVMDPGKRYKFPGTKVYEFPIPNIEPAGYQRLPSLTTNPQYQNRSRLNVSPYGFIDAWDNNIVPNLGIDADYNVNPNLNVGFRGLGMRNVMTPGDGTLRNDFQFNYPSGYVRATIPYRDKRKNLPKHQLHGIVPKQKPVAPRAMDMTPEEFHQMQAVQKAKNKTPKTTYGHISQEERNRLRTEAEVNAKQKWNSENITPKSETFTKADFIEQKKREFKSNPKPFYDAGITDADLYDDQGNYDWESVAMKMETPEFKSKLISNFENWEQGQYDKLPLWKKGVHNVGSFVHDPILTGSRLMQGERPMFGQSVWLNDADKAQELANQFGITTNDLYDVSGENESSINDYFKWVNPGNYGAKAGLAYDKGDYTNAVMHALPWNRLAKTQDFINLGRRAKTAGNYLTTKTPLSDVHRINPFAKGNILNPFPKDNAYRFIGGDKGLADAKKSGVFRSKRNDPSSKFTIRGDQRNTFFGIGKPDNRYKYKSMNNPDHSTHLVSVPLKHPNLTPLKNKPGEAITPLGKEIGINEAGVKVYKTDWLRGYKKVHEGVNYAKNKIKSGTSDNTFANHMRHLMEEASGSLTGNTKKATQEGNAWLNAWIQDPATQNKLTGLYKGKKMGLMNDMDSYTENMIRWKNNLSKQGYTESSSIKPFEVPPYLKDNMANIALQENAAKTFVANTKTYPLLNQVKDAVTRTRPPIHFDNLGVYYSGLGKGHPRTGAFVSRAPSTGPKSKTSISIHEGTHDWTDGNFGLRETDEFDFINANLRPEYQPDFNPEAQIFGPGHLSVPQNKTMDYFKDPTEVHTRIMELRYRYNLKPGQTVTPDMADLMLKNIKAGKTNVETNFEKLFNSPDKLANLFNHLRVAAPIGTGIGLSSQKDLPSYQFSDGGNLPKHQDIGIVPNRDQITLNTLKSLEDSLGLQPKNISKWHPRTGATEQVSFNAKTNKFTVPGGGVYNLDDYSAIENLDPNAYPIYNINDKLVAADTDFMRNYGILSQKHPNRGKLYLGYNNPNIQDASVGIEKYGGNWIQDAAASIKRRGTKGVCTGDKFGGPTCRPGTKRYNLAKTFRAMANKKYGGSQNAPQNMDTEGLVNSKTANLKNFFAKNAYKALLNDEAANLVQETNRPPEGYHQMPDGSMMADSEHMAYGGASSEWNYDPNMYNQEMYQDHYDDLMGQANQNFGDFWDNSMNAAFSFATNKPGWKTKEKTELTNVGDALTAYNKQLKKYMMKNKRNKYMYTWPQQRFGGHLPQHQTTGPVGWETVDEDDYTSQQAYSTDHVPTYGVGTEYNPPPSAWNYIDQNYGPVYRPSKTKEAIEPLSAGDYFRQRFNPNNTQGLTNPFAGALSGAAGVNAGVSQQIQDDAAARAAIDNQVYIPTTGNTNNNTEEETEYESGVNYQWVNGKWVKQTAKGKESKDSTDPGDSGKGDRGNYDDSKDEKNTNRGGYGSSRFPGYSYLDGPFSAKFRRIGKPYLKKIKGTISHSMWPSESNSQNAQNNSQNAQNSNASQNNSTVDYRSHSSFNDVLEQHNANVDDYNKSPELQQEVNRILALQDSNIQKNKNWVDEYKQIRASGDPHNQLIDPTKLPGFNEAQYDIGEYTTSPDLPAEGPIDSPITEESIWNDLANSPEYQSQGLPWIDAQMEKLKESTNKEIKKTAKQWFRKGRDKWLLDSGVEEENLSDFKYMYGHGGGLPKHQDVGVVGPITEGLSNNPYFNSSEQRAMSDAKYRKHLAGQRTNNRNPEAEQAYGDLIKNYQPHGPIIPLEDQVNELNEKYPYYENFREIPFKSGSGLGFRSEGWDEYFNMIQNSSNPEMWNNRNSGSQVGTGLIKKTGGELPQAQMGNIPQFTPDQQQQLYLRSLGLDPNDPYATTQFKSKQVNPGILDGIGFGVDSAFAGAIGLGNILDANRNTKLNTDRQMSDAQFAALGAGDAFKGVHQWNTGENYPDKRNPVFDKGYTSGFIGSPAMSRFGGQLPQHQIDGVVGPSNYSDFVDPWASGPVVDMPNQSFTENELRMLDQDAEQKYRSEGSGRGYPYGPYGSMGMPADEFGNPLSPHVIGASDAPLDYQKCGGGTKMRYQEGGEYYLDDNEIQQILAMGGQIEYL